MATAGASTARAAIEIRRGVVENNSPRAVASRARFSLELETT
jgi:hypothetical protein